MDEKRQIEEMAFDIVKATSPLGVKDLTKQFDYKTVATDLYELYGWRKSSEVAREIFEEIENAHEECIHIDSSTNIGYLLQTKFVLKLAELKKKYAGVGE